MDESLLMIPDDNDGFRRCDSEAARLRIHWYAAPMAVAL